MKTTTKSWIDFSTKDFRLAEKLQDDEYFSNIVLFHCEQAIEKIMKAVLEEFSVPIPKTHNLIKLYNLFPDSIKSLLTIKEDDLIPIEEVYIDSRYPSDIGLLPLGLPTKDDVLRIFELTQRIYEEINELISK